MKAAAAHFDGKFVLAGVAGLAALAILGLLGTIVWMSLRTGVPGQPSAYSFTNYFTLIGDPYMYRVMWTTLRFAAVTIGLSVPLVSKAASFPLTI